MTKLEILYASIKYLNDLGLSLNEETLKEADELEEQLIKTEIQPALSKDIEPMLLQIQREFVLVVEYKPSTPISVALSRKTNITELLDAKKLELDPEVHHKEICSRRNKMSKKAPATGLCVRLINGVFIQEKNAATTFTKAIVTTGLMRVSNLGIISRGINMSAPLLIANMVAPNVKWLLAFMSLHTTVRLRRNKYSRKYPHHSSWDGRSIL